MKVKLLKKLRDRVEKEVYLLSPGEFREIWIGGVLKLSRYDLFSYTLISRYKPDQKFKDRGEAVNAYDKEKRERFKILFSIEKRKRLNPCLPR